MLFYTGWNEYCVAGEGGKDYVYNSFILVKKPGWPSPSVEAMQYLYERGVVCVGTDGPSMGAAHEGAPVHWYGLGKGILYVESHGL